MKTDAGYDLVLAVMATADTFLRESQRLFRPFGLTAAQYNVLNVVGPRAEGMSQRELGDVLVVDRSNVTGLLDRMEKAGWVRRADDPTDRRVYRITLTPSGRKLWRKIGPKYLAAIAQVTAGLSAAEMVACTGRLNRLAQQAANWSIGAEGAK